MMQKIVDRFPYGGSHHILPSAQDDSDDPDDCGFPYRIIQILTSAPDDWDEPDNWDNLNNYVETRISTCDSSAETFEHCFLF